MSKYAKKEIINEIIKCGKDPIYFLNKYAKIQHPVKGLIPFKTYHYQDDVVKAYLNNRMNICLKARQLGLTTVTAGFAAWLVLFHRDKNVLIVATKQDTAKNMVRTIKNIFKHIPKWMRDISKITVDNRHSIEFANGSRVKAVATSGDVGRSEAVSFLIVDEVAHIPNFEEIWTGLAPTLSTGGQVALFSCVTENTFVFTDEGLKQVKDFVSQGKTGGYEVSEYSVLGKDKLRKGSLFFNNGKKETKKIKTSFSDLECTPNHKVWSFKDGEFKWVQAGELQEGDWLSIQSGMQVWGNFDDVSSFQPSVSSKIKCPFNPKVISEDLAYFLGLFIAEGSTYDGSLQGGSVTITCGDEVEQSVKKLGLDVSVQENPEGKNCNKYTISSKNFIEFLEYLGFDLSKKAKDKVIPSRLLMMSKENIFSMLRGIFDGDGYAHVKKGVVGISLSSEKLIDQIRMLLLNGGMHAYKMKDVPAPTELVSVESDYYKLELPPTDSKLFYQVVGFSLSRKQERGVLLERLKEGNGNDKLPLTKEHVKYLRKMTGLRDKELLQNCIYTNGFLSGHSKNISRRSALRLLELVPDKSKVQHSLLDSVCDNLRWVQIKDIEDGEAETYDFSLPHNEEDFWCHSVVYNGVVGHQTPLGTANFFHKTWVDAKNGNNNFNCRFGTYVNPENPEEVYNDRLMYWVHPNHDSEWLAEETKGRSHREVAQEYLCNFNASGDTFIWHEDIARIEKRSFEPDDKLNTNRDVWIWERPQKNQNYIISCDVSRGDAADYSAFHVIKLGPEILTQVAEYKGKIKPDQLGILLMSVSELYNNAMVAPENNSGWSGQTILRMEEANFPNIYYSKRTKPKTRDQYAPDPYYAAMRNDYLPGYAVTSANRTPMLAKVEEYIRKDIIEIYSPRFVEELKTFIVNPSNRPEAQRGYHDDLIMALAGGLWVRDEAFIRSYRSDEMTKAMLDGMSTSQTSTQSFIDLNRSSNIYDRNKIREHVNEQNKIVMNDGQEYDISWLIGKG